MINVKHDRLHNESCIREKCEDENIDGNKRYSIDSNNLIPFESDNNNFSTKNKETKEDFYRTKYKKIRLESIYNKVMRDKREEDQNIPDIIIDYHNKYLVNKSKFQNLNKYLNPK